MSYGLPKIVQSDWKSAYSPVGRARVLLPLIPTAADGEAVTHVSEVIHIVALIRALLLEKRLPTAFDTYHELLREMDDARRITAPIWEEAQTIIGMGSTPKARERFEALKSDTETEVEPYDPKAPLVLPPAGERLVADYLFGSDVARRMLLLIATLDLLGIDPLSLDALRAERFETWGVVYGPNRTRASRSERRRVRAELKRQGWRQYDDAATMAHAVEWVQVHHVFGGLSAYVKATKPDALTQEIAAQSAVLRGFDDALGRERIVGRPRQSRPVLKSP